MECEHRMLNFEVQINQPDSTVKHCRALISQSSVRRISILTLDIKASLQVGGTFNLEPPVQDSPYQWGGYCHPKVHALVSIGGKFGDAQRAEASLLHYAFNSMDAALMEPNKFISDDSQTSMLAQRVEYNEAAYSSFLLGNFCLISRPNVYNRVPMVYSVQEQPNESLL